MIIIWFNFHNVFIFFGFGGGTIDYLFTFSTWITYRWWCSCKIVLICQVYSFLLLLLQIRKQLVSQVAAWWVNLNWLSPSDYSCPKFLSLVIDHKNLLCTVCLHILNYNVCRISLFVKISESVLGFGAQIFWGAAG